MAGNKQSWEERAERDRVGNWAAQAGHIGRMPRLDQRVLPLYEGVA
jgi:hypothetical protein